MKHPSKEINGAPKLSEARKAELRRLLKSAGSIETLLQWARGVAAEGPRPARGRPRGSTRHWNIDASLIFRADEIFKQHGLKPMDALRAAVAEAKEQGIWPANLAAKCLKLSELSLEARANLEGSPHGRAIVDRRKREKPQGLTDDAIVKRLRDQLKLTPIDRSSGSPLGARNWTYDNLSITRALAKLPPSPPPWRKSRLIRK